MAEIDETAIEGKAREQAAKDGLAWEPSEGGARYTPLKLRACVTEEQREQYLARARAELQSEADDA
ncbi:MAG TPA: hypothetical protein VNV38_17925 [Stellaceae bacterium]|jgi:hypothetical protein|nr:hypothetical protein [Stellaceae bacterium]